MDLDRAIRQTLTLEYPESFDRVRQHMKLEWVMDALKVSGTATVRRRRLPAEVVVWIVLAIALFRNRSIADVVSKLDLSLPSTRNAEVVSSAIVQARQRIGSEPLAVLFHRSASEWAHSSAAAHRWNGLSVYGVDGTSVRLQDTPEIRSHFGGHPAGDGVVSSYPIARVVALMALRSHVIADVAFGPFDIPELTLAEALWDSVPGDSLVILDKGFLSASVLLNIQNGAPRRHWLTRAKSNTKWRVLKTFGDGDVLVEMDISSVALQRDSTLPKTWRARAVRYQRKGHQPSWLLTSLEDPEAYPASELIELYHERWEIEIGYDELKTELLDREETLRSKSVDGVNQELWGVLITYNLIRVEIERIAAEAGVEPTRISFVSAMRLIADEWLWCAVGTPGTIPKKLAALREKVMKRFILPPRKGERSYPREVKLRTSHYPKKKAENRPQLPN